METGANEKRQVGAYADYQLLLSTLEKQVLQTPVPQEVTELLAKREIWQSLEAEEACRWARIAQVAGLAEISLEVLEWVNRTHPHHEPAWLERIELLRLLERRPELVSVRAQAMIHCEAEKIRAVLREGSHEAPVPFAGGAPLGDTELGKDVAGSPFLDLRREEEDLRLFMDLFQGREDAFARQWYEKEKDASGYIPVRRPMQPEDVKDHLRGKRTYGIYLLRRDSTARVGVIDIDLVQKYRSGQLSREENSGVKSEGKYLLKRLAELSAEASLPCIIEFSGGKGYHFWYPFENPVPAGVVRSALELLAAKVRRDVECFGLEVFPKQDQLSGKGLGNLVKLPLGIHRGTGKASYFLMAKDRSPESQMDFLRGIQRIGTAALETLARTESKARVLVHPRHEAWAGEYPELAILEAKCVMIAQILANCRGSRSLSVREEKILLGTIGHLPRAKHLLHHLFEQLPEYNRPLLDYKISRIRGTVIGCKRIHSLLEDGEGGLPCRFETKETNYWHPLLHLEDEKRYDDSPKSERVSNLQDAMENLSLALRQVKRFLE